MVNWREDVEFIYVLIMLVSSIVVFFVIYQAGSMALAAVTVAIALVVEGIILYAAFESPKAIVSWEKLEKKKEQPTP